MFWKFIKGYHPAEQFSADTSHSAMPETVLSSSGSKLLWEWHHRFWQPMHFSS